MNYKVVIPNQVYKSIKDLNEDDEIRIITKLKTLQENPTPINSIKMKGYDNQYRIRIGNYRVRYLINKKEFEVVILDVAHRKDIYRKK